MAIRSVPIWTIHQLCKEKKTPNLLLGITRSRWEAGWISANANSKYTPGDGQTSSTDPFGMERTAFVPSQSIRTRLYTKQAAVVKLGSMDILFIGFLYSSFLFHQKQLEEKTNESKATGDNSILSTKHWTPTACQCTWPGCSQEHRAARVTWKVMWKPLEQQGTHLIHVSCDYTHLIIET